MRFVDHDIAIPMQLSGTTSTIFCAAGVGATKDINGEPYQRYNLYRVKYRSATERASRSPQQHQP